MPPKQALERLGNTQLAVLCQQVGDDPNTDSRSAEKARQLKHEWALLQMPPAPTLKERMENEGRQAALRSRMIEFLSTAL